MNLLKTMAMVVAIILLAGCGGSRNWKEEVRLADGQIIEVDRWAKLGNPLDREIQDLGSGSPTIGYGIRIRQPETGKYVLWETDKTLTPLALGFRGRVIYLAASPRFCWAYDQLGRPVPPYVFLKYEESAWQRIPVEEFPEEIRHANLFVGSRERDVGSGEVSARQTEESNRSLSSYLRNIYRSGIKGMEMCIRKLPPKPNGKEK